LRRKLSDEQFHQRALDLVDATRDDLVASYAKSPVHGRACSSLTDWCHWHGWLVAVVSNGFDFAVGTVLDDLKLDRIARHAGRTRFTYRWRVNYYSPRGVEVQDGFQLSYVTAFRSAGDFVAMVGGSGTASDAALQAADVFARDDLTERLGGAHSASTDGASSRRHLGARSGILTSRQTRRRSSPGLSPRPALASGSSGR